MHKRVADQGQAETVYNHLPFPPGTHIELANMPAAMLNGIRGVVDGTTQSGMGRSEGEKKRRTTTESMT
jgi:hypothetical protein